MHNDLKPENYSEDVDTLLTGFQISNPAFASLDYNGYCGNIGSAISNSLSVDAGIVPAFGFNAFRPYQFTERPISFADARIINSRFLYTRGVKKEQHFLASHYQHILKNLAVGIDYRRTFSPGMYKNQSTDVTAFDGYLLYETRNHRYGFFSSYISNVVKNDESGGLITDTALYNSQRADWISVPVNLSDGKSFNRNRQFVFKQQYNFKVTEHLSADDSLISSDAKLYLQHWFRYSKDSYTFTNSVYDSSYFTTIYYDTAFTFDSSYYDQLYNRVLLGYQNQQGTVSATAGAEIVSGDYTNRELVSHYNPVNLVASFNTVISQKLFFDNYAVLNILNQQGTFAYEGTISYQHTTDLTSGLNLLLKKEKPDFRQQNYYSNHYQWTNSFSNPVVLSASVFAVYKSYEVEGGLNTYSNYIAADTAGIPVQYGNAVNVGWLKFNYHFIKNRWHLRGNLTLQSSSFKQAIQLPVLNTYTSVFYATGIRNKQFDFQMGLDCFYNTAYYSNGYNPATGFFHYQNTTTTGNFAYVDVFLSSRIKSVKFYLKCENVGGRAWGDEFFMTAHYPLFGRSFKMGIEWRFYN